MSKHILLAITGGIAAYKSCELVRLLKKQGHHVRIAMSKAATEFIAPQTFQALSGESVLLENGGTGNGMHHINATREADVMIIAPATANTIAKIAAGIADNLITELASARTCPLIIAPAMNVQMWHNPANQRNIKQLQTDGIHLLMPTYGEQACGEVGEGRMLEANEIADCLADIWAPKLLNNKKVVLTVGAGYEAIDPVRGITNISSGAMGMALARACRQAGANVHLIYGKISVPIPFGLQSSEQAIDAQSMLHAVEKKLPETDIFISVAAVADYRVNNRSNQKLKKENGAVPILKLIENPDILKTVAQKNNPPFCVGFAAESEHVIDHARQKRKKKGIPLLIANDVSIAMGSERNQITLIDDFAETTLPESDKNQAAWAIVQRIAELIKLSPPL